MRLQTRSVVLAACLVAGVQSAPALAHAGSRNPQTDCAWGRSTGSPLGRAPMCARRSGEAEDNGFATARQPCGRVGTARFLSRRLGGEETWHQPCQARSSADTGMAMSVVLIPQVMWTRYGVPP